MEEVRAETSSSTCFVEDTWVCQQAGRRPVLHAGSRQPPAEPPKVRSIPPRKGCRSSVCSRVIPASAAVLPRRRPLPRDPFSWCKSKTEGMVTHCDTAQVTWLPTEFGVCRTCPTCACCGVPDPVSCIRRRSKGSCRTLGGCLNCPLGIWVEHPNPTPKS